MTVIEAPSSAGADAPGQEDGPGALLQAGFIAELEAVGVAARRGGQTARFRWRPDTENPRAANAAAVTDRAREVAELVRCAPVSDRVVVLGGDCTVGIGTVAGLLERVDRLGLVYLDRHADLNVPSSVIDGDLDWMGVAHMLGVDGAVEKLAGMTARRPLLESDQISFLGLGPHTDFEAEVIAKRGLSVIDVDRVISSPRGSARNALTQLSHCDAIAVHFDVDLVDFLDAPLAENTDRGTAPSLAVCGEVLDELLAQPRVRALTVTEFNPHHGLENGQTTRRLVDVLVNALSLTD